ncbi:MAG TPA: ABC transporter permease [bacterium]|nr:ABC transporter permease [bacterium]
MLRHIAERLLWSVPVLLGVSLVVFGILKAIPGDAAQVMAGADATAADVQAIRNALGLNQPVYVQYARWLERFVRLDLGRSAVTRRPVAYEIATRVGPTAELAAAAMAFAAAVGLAAGITSATHQHSAWDAAASVATALGISVPIFWLGLMLMMLFSVSLRWLPSTGAGTAAQLILPALTLGAATAATVARQVRAAMLDVLRQDYLRTALAKGVARGTLVLRHAFRNAVIPIVTVLGLQLGYLLAGTVLTETVFARPGLGRLVVDAIRSRDIAVVQATVMLFSMTFIAVNLAVDLLYAYLDPRIRFD